MHASRWILVTALSLVPSLAASSIASAAESTHPAREDTQEWAQAWQSLTEAERATLTEAWKNAVEKAKSLSPEHKAQLKAAIVAFSVALSDAITDLSPEHKQALQAKLVELRDAYRALTAEQKRQFLAKTAKAIESSKIRRAQRKAFRAALRQSIEQRA